MSPSVLALAALAALPFACVAQTDPGTPRFYVGLEANLLTNSPFSSLENPNLYGATLTAGKWLTPRLALQIGAGLSGRTTPVELFNLGAGTAKIRARNVTIPLLARYSLTPPAKPFHLDALAGFTYLRSTASVTYENSFSLGSDESSFNQYNFSVGPALRQALTPRLALTADALFNVALNNSYRYDTRLSLHLLAGVQYTWGQQ